MSSPYGQTCPLAVASEIFAERWTPIILRELVFGRRGFNDIHRGAPRISRALLAKRLRDLIDAEIVTAAGGEYRLTEAGQELGEVVVQLGKWGQRWTELVQRDRLDTRARMWDVRHRIAVDRLPEKRVVVQFDFSGVPAQPKMPRRYWLVMTRAEVDLCILETGYEVDLFVSADLALFSRVWHGAVPLRQAIREGAIRLKGDPKAEREFPSWILLNALAGVPKPGDSTERRVA
jgi:DNA-binding HxlR family transcriptional regulator